MPAKSSCLGLAVYNKFDLSNTTTVVPVALLISTSIIKGLTRDQKCQEVVLPKSQFALVVRRCL